MQFSQLKILEPQIDRAQVSVRLVVVRVDAQDGLELGLRFVELILREVKRSQIVMWFVVVGGKLDGSAKMFIQPAALGAV